jgi:hypothetical protein
MNQYHVKIVGQAVTDDYSDVKASSCRVAVSKAMAWYTKDHGEKAINNALVRVAFVCKIVKQPVEAKQ